VAAIITGVVIHFRFHIRCISIYKLLYFNFCYASFCTTFLSAGLLLLLLLLLLLYLIFMKNLLSSDPLCFKFVRYNLRFVLRHHICIVFLLKLFLHTIHIYVCELTSYEPFTWLWLHLFVSYSLRPKS
jgi:hypothetical protein